MRRHPKTFLTSRKRLFRLSRCTTRTTAAQRRMAAIPVACVLEACGRRVLKQARPWLVAMAFRRGVFYAAIPTIGYFV